MKPKTEHSGVYMPAWESKFYARSDVLVDFHTGKIHVANNRNMKSWRTSVFWAGTGVAADASGQNARSCCGSSAPGGASMYSTSMQMPTVSRASTCPGNKGAGSSTESSLTTG